MEMEGGGEMEIKWRWRQGARERETERGKRRTCPPFRLAMFRGSVGNVPHLDLYLESLLEMSSRLDLPGLEDKPCLFPSWTLLTLQWISSEVDFARPILLWKETTPPSAPAACLFPPFLTYILIVLFPNLHLNTSSSRAVLSSRNLMWAPSGSLMCNFTLASSHMRLPLGAHIRFLLDSTALELLVLRCKLGKRTIRM